MESIEDIVVEVSSFDGTIVWFDKNIPLYEVGNFLGSGTSGTVYEAENINTKETFALKILNPIGYKILSPSQLSSFIPFIKGKPFPEYAERSRDPLRKEHIWWLLSGPTKQFHAAYFSEKQKTLKELSLTQCIQLWGKAINNPCNSAVQSIQSYSGQSKIVPVIPSKFSDFLNKRRRIIQEIRNMRKVSNHANVIRLESVLELTQESKCTIFLVMEFANGGELFDRIKEDTGTRETTAKLYFKQLLSGVNHCHSQGVCHRDLKPENLLLSDTQDFGTILKVADFGFSAGVQEEEDEYRILNRNTDYNNLPDGRIDISSGGGSVIRPVAISPQRTLRSIVGSPYYVAPEVLQARGYDGLKADMWSLGIILYAMLAGSLPFEQELATCRRYRSFCRWVHDQAIKDIYFLDERKKKLQEVLYPMWLFPVHFSQLVKGFICCLLYPNPDKRISVVEALLHPWCCVDTTEGAAATSTSDCFDYKDEDLAREYVKKSLVLSLSQKQSRENFEPIIDEEDEEEEEEVSYQLGDDFGLLFDDDSVDDERDQEEEEEEDLQNEFGTPSSSKRSKWKKKPQRPGSVSAGKADDDDPLDGGDGDDDGGELKSHSKAVPIPIPQPTTEEGVSYGNRKFPFSDLLSSPPFSQPSFPVDRASYVPDFLNTSDDYDSDSSPEGTATSELPARISANTNPPSFSNKIERSTRFLTGVPAIDVLEKVDHMLMECLENKVVTPIGLIVRKECIREHYRINVWSSDNDSNVSLFCGLQLYEVTTGDSVGTAATSAAPYGTSTSGYGQRSFDSFDHSYKRDSSDTLHFTLLSDQDGPQYIVEFIRGQLKTFAFKKFYRWIRNKVAYLVKRDIESKLLDHDSIAS